MYVYTLSDHVAQSVIFFVYGEYSCVWYFSILFSNNPINIIVILLNSVIIYNTYFFSPSYKRKDSNVGGAFIFNFYLN